MDISVLARHIPLAYLHIIYIYILFLELRSIKKVRKIFFSDALGHHLAPNKMHHRHSPFFNQVIHGLMPSTQSAPVIRTHWSLRQFCHGHSRNGIIHRPLRIGTAHHLPFQYIVSWRLVGQQIKHVGILQHGSVHQKPLHRNRNMVLVHTVRLEISAISIIVGHEDRHATGLA